MKKILAAMAVTAAVTFVPTVAGAAPVTGGAGAGYGEHIAGHAGDEGDFSGQMNPGDHRGFAGFDEHH